MMKLKPTGINLETLKSLFPKNPVPKRRTPLWFFTEEHLNELKKYSEDERCKVNRSKLRDHWNGMKPENKRKYFNLAEMDKFRYEKQKALWVAHLCSLISGSSSDLHLSRDAIEEIALGSQEELHNMFANYKNIIQTKSTQSIYRDALRGKNSDSEQATESVTSGTNHLISQIPEPFRLVLKAPRRPAPTCILFYKDHKERITQLKREKYPEFSFFKVASLEWSKLEPKERAIYESRYEESLKQYLRDIEQFKLSKATSMDGSRLDEASKEKKAFRKALRMKLRNFTAVPRNVRNAFNFYVIHNRNLPIEELSRMWRELDEEEKLLYKRMSDEDKMRYKREKSMFDRVSKELLGPNSSKSVS